MRCDEASLNSTSPMIESGLSSRAAFSRYSRIQAALQGLRVSSENEQRISRLRHASSSAGGALNPLACTITVFEP
jgi:hypothetical protein